MEAKVKEEAPDKDYQPTTTERRKSTTVGNKDRRSPEQEEVTSPTPGPPGPPSPQNNGTAALSSTESLSPPLAESRAAPALQRLRKFLSALLQFAQGESGDTGERVKQLIFNLVASNMTIEEFQAGVQECTNYPLRASVPGFLRALLPLAQRDLTMRARRAKQTLAQYVRSHDHVVLEAGGDGAEIFQPEAVKRRASDPFYENASTNGGHEDYPGGKRPSMFLQPMPFLYGGSAGLFDYPHPYHNYHGGEPPIERRDGGISVRDVSSMNASFSEPRPAPGSKCDDEWKNINTMLNCILSMVEKTKRALAILQQRGMEPTENTDIKRAASEIMAAAVRQTEERVAEVRRRAEDAVNQVKRQALVELQRAVSAAEGRALELQPPPPRDLSPGAASQQNCCWNCGRKAQETCSGCNAARYCGAFCQHRDWENHHQVCSGRDQKPSTLLRTSPPSTLPKPPLPRAATPITTQATTPLLPLATITQDRHNMPTHQERLAMSSERMSQERPSDRLMPSERLASDRLMPSERLASDRLMAQDRNLQERNVPSDRLITQERGLQPDRLMPSERNIPSDRLMPSERNIPSDRLMPSERSLNTERLTLASLSTAQGMIGIGKK